MAEDLLPQRRCLAALDVLEDPVLDRCMHDKLKFSRLVFDSLVDVQAASGVDTHGGRRDRGRRQWHNHAYKRS
jgi:hypothetical protein